MGGRLWPLRPREVDRDFDEPSLLLCTKVAPAVHANAGVRDRGEGGLLCILLQASSMCVSVGI